MKRTRGFTLVELIMIIVLLGIGLTGLMAMFGRSVGSLDENTDIQTGAQLVQQCAERIIGTRRQSTGGYALITNLTCSGLPLPAGYLAHAVTVAPHTGSACPGGANCNEVQITVSNAGGTVARGNLLLVEY